MLFPAETVSQTRMSKGLQAADFSRQDSCTGGRARLCRCLWPQSLGQDRDAASLFLVLRSELHAKHVSSP